DVERGEDVPPGVDDHAAGVAVVRDRLQVGQVEEAGEVVLLRVVLEEGVAVEAAEAAGAWLAGERRVAVRARHDDGREARAGGLGGGAELLFGGGEQFLCGRL